MTTALETAHLSKRYGRTWALRDCTLALPAGRVAALVGPNGAGKTTLLHLCGGLLEPTASHVQVFGHSPLRQTAETLPRLSFLAQDHPLYRDFSVADLLMLGRRLNPHWDDALAGSRMQKLDIPFSGPVLIAGTVMALALGIFAGTLTRRTVSAIFLPPRAAPGGPCARRVQPAPEL